MKNISFLLPLILCCCIEPTFFPLEIVSAEYFNDDTCKLGYRGGSNGGHYDFFKNLIASNSGKFNTYSCKDFKWIDRFTPSLTKTYYVLWRANEKWDKGKTVEFMGLGSTDKIRFKVPN